ncbi:MAG: MAPEG family protein [Deltaproteobacteria bacterium]|nr:MAG: MAPEG family protein [Deltaproteobacteria bacterium]
MKPELFWLALTATMTGLFWIPYILNRAMRSGLAGALATPMMGAPTAEAEWAQRSKRAHSNAVENLVVFAALVTVAQFAGVSNQVTAFAAALYFWTRLGHFVVLTLGIPYLRTLIWTASWVAEMIIAWQVLVAH